MTIRDQIDLLRDEAFIVDLFRLAYRMGEMRTESKGLRPEFKQSLVHNTATNDDIRLAAVEQIERRKNEVKKC